MKEPISVELLEKYINGTCTDSEAAEVKNWYLSFKDEDDHVSAISPAAEQELEARIYKHILSNIGISEDEEAPVIKQRSGFLQIWYSIAGTAAAVILIAGSIMFYQGHKKAASADAESTTQQLVTITNNTGQIYKAILPDKALCG